MEKLLVILFIVISPLMLTACQEQNDDTNETAPLENLFSQTDLSYGEYVFIFEDIVNRTKSMNIEDESLEKWVIRALGDEKISNKRDLTKEEALEIAKENQELNTAWLAVAEKQYNVMVTEEELDNWIEEGPDQDIFPQQKAYAEALGLTVYQLNHGYDRELYEQTLVWEKLFSRLTEEYHTEDQNELLRQYQKEVKQEVEKEKEN
ncbi:hypothetical protein [Sutcliffiella deserti]|uniref:hypothetical protein n=1 Tax=Sutcliffiella deserti TaxID=2875501 RepID=UPI001CBE2436|nr:hypothetical protein [Sutcliffiella deserti]